VHSPIGRLPTPAEALDAPDWPSTGGYDTTPGAAPPVPRSFEQQPRREHKPEPREHKPEPREPAMADAPAAARADEPKQERSSIASFFGFGSKPEEPAPEPTEPRPQRKGWWRKPDA
jgi:hypothetical protein